MDRQPAATAAAERYTRNTRPREPIPAPIRAIVTQRLAELHPLHLEYTHLLQYQRMLDAPPEATNARPTPAPRAKHGAARELILAALRHGATQTETELAESTGAQPGTLSYNLRRLARQGQIETTQLEHGTGYRLAREQSDTATER